MARKKSLFRFRKRIKIAPGVYVNLSKSGASVSAGPKGATVNFGKDGTRVTTGIPGSGISSTQYFPNAASNTRRGQANAEPPADLYTLNADGYRKVSGLLLLGLIVAPYLFVWWLFRPGYSLTARVTACAWAVIVANKLLFGQP